MNKAVEEIIESSKEVIATPRDCENFISTGNVTLNLACSGMPDGAFQLGKVHNIIGSSSSGKSFLALSCLAECSRDSKFKNYKLIYDDVEAANSFDINYLFGEKAVKRIDMERSERVEDLFCNINKALNNKEQFVWIVDSWDALTTAKEITKTEETLDAYSKDKKVSGDYGMQKPKVASQMLRMICGKLKDSNSALIIISQTRDDIDPMTFSKVTRSGGRALKFYSSTEMWLATIGDIKKTVKGESYSIGVKTKVKVTKSKEDGRKRVVNITILYDYGIDNITDCVEFLLKHKLFTKTTKINAPQFKFSGTKKALIKKIEEENLEKKLSDLVAKTWMEIEEALKENRKRKF